MWPFKKREPKAPTPHYIEEIVHNTIKPISVSPDNPFVIKVGISHYDNKPDLYRVFFILPSSSLGDMRVFPRQQDMVRERALVVADAWVKALEVTYDMSLEQMVCNLD